MTNEELLQENAELRRIGQQAMDEREVLIKGYDAIRKLFKGRDWLMEGRGCYPYNDDRYKQEVRYIMDAFNEINKNVWRDIKSKTFEYRKAVEKPLLEKISELENRWMQGKPNIEHTCLMMVKVYSNDKFLWDEYIVGRIDETGSVVFMNDEGTGWEQDAIECWMEIPKGATAVEAVTPINTSANGA